MTTSGQNNGSAVEAERTPWRQIGIGLGLSLVGTLLVGGILLFILDNIWFGTLAGILSLFGGGLYVGRSTGQPESLYGTLLAASYVGLAVVVIFGGSLWGVLPDPLPGLAIGDSTFFFVSPLLLLVSGVGGSVVGGQMAGRKGHQQ